MSVILPARDIIGLLRDIKSALLGEVQLGRKVAQELTLQDVRELLSEIQQAPIPRTLIDAFGRQRVSNVFTIFDSKQIVDNQPNFWDSATTGTGTVVYNNSEAATVLSVSAAGDTALRQTFRRFNYQPSKSQLILLTGVIRNAGAFDTGVTAYLGQYEPNAGLFFRYDESNGIQVGIRKNAVDILFPQAAWNLDRFDGTGPSGITLDVTKTQIFVINYEWLGVGSVWFGFYVNGQLYWVHREDHSNIADSVYMQTPNSPLCFEIVSTTGAAGSMTQICCSINSEGGRDKSGVSFAVGMPSELTLLSGATNPEKVLIALRYKSLSTSQVDINTDALSVVSSGGTTNVMAVVLRIIKDEATQLRNSTDTGPPTITWTPISNSALEFAAPTGGNAVFVVKDNFTGASGHILDMTSLSGSSSTKTAIRNSLKLGFSIAGVSDILVLTGYPFDNQAVNATIGWTEL